MSDAGCPLQMSTSEAEDWSRVFALEKAHPGWRIVHIATWAELGWYTPYWRGTLLDEDLRATATVEAATLEAIENGIRAHV